MRGRLRRPDYDNRSGRANCTPHKFQPLENVMRTTRAFSRGILRRNVICFARGGSGISSDTCDRNGKERRIARSAPPALSLSRVQNSKNSLPCPLIPRTNTGMARQIRAHRRRSRSSFGEAWRRFGMHNHTEIGVARNTWVTTNDNLGGGAHVASSGCG